jgi:TonB family protein
LSTNLLVCTRRQRFGATLSPGRGPLMLSTQSRSRVCHMARAFCFSGLWVLVGCEGKRPDTSDPTASSNASAPARVSTRPDVAASSDTPRTPPVAAPEKVPNARRLRSPSGDPRASSAAADDSLEAGLPLGPPLGRVYSPSDLDRAPQFANRSFIETLAEALYPPALRDARVGGTVTVEFVVREDGRVSASSIKVLQTPHQQLVDPSIALVRRFGFRPGRNGEERVATRMKLPFTWDPAS